MIKKNYNKGETSVFVSILLAFGIISLIGVIGMLLMPVCSYPGCENAPKRGSKYCWNHSTSDSRHSSGSHSSSESSSATTDESEDRWDSTTSSTDSYSTTTRTTTEDPYIYNRRTTEATEYEMPDCDDYEDYDDFMDDWDGDMPDGSDAEDYWEDW